MPGDPIDEMLKNNPDATPEDVALMKKNLGLDKPIPIRYAKWMWDVSKGDFGDSRTYKKPVSEMLWPRLRLLRMGRSTRKPCIRVAVEVLQRAGSAGVRSSHEYHVMRRPTVTTSKS